ncbi:MAG: metallophosphatase family protein [Candidatus Omnitrophica bacterium]|nr:metallophosphatase family protein [Candidatus Omnitrophota bacterium]MCM8777798.1 metallophosphatase family protein [Candidatus Omnitrophota bacterium]
MRIGIISDVHGNLEALNSTLLFLNSRIDFLAVLGDTVGYGPDPEECIGTVKIKANLILKGNHEEGIITGNYTAFKDIARVSLEWTAKVITSDSLKSIREFKETAEVEDILFVHAAISSPLFKYIISDKDAMNEFALLDKKICFIGHTHIPAAYRKEGEDRIDVIHPDFSGKMEIEIEQGYKYIINTGSTGQPRDGFPFACASIYDTEKHLFTLHRVEYPVEITRKKILEKGLPSVLARRVVQGI